MGCNSLVAPSKVGRLGNCVLHTFRAFWFACVHGIPLRNVVIRSDPDAEGHPLFSRISRHFMPCPEFDALSFNVRPSCHLMPVRQERQYLFDLEVGDQDNVQLVHGSLYPELPWERALFISIFDNPEFRSSVAARYGALLGGNTVGYTIRRTDTLSLPHYNTLTELSVVCDIRAIVDKYRGLVRVLVASDDMPFVRRVAERYPDVGKHLSVVDADEDTTIFLLSMCDTVFSNGEAQCCSWWANRGFKHSMCASTFGQVAQMLNRCYGYAGISLPPSCDIARPDFVCDGGVPDGVLASRDGDTCEYPEFIA